MRFPCEPYAGAARRRESQRHRQVRKPHCPAGAGGGAEGEGVEGVATESRLTTRIEALNRQDSTYHTRNLLLILA